MIAHRVVWSALTLSFVAVSVPCVYRGVLAHSLQPPAAFHSSDSFLRFATDAPVSSEQVIALLGAVRQETTVLIFDDNTDPRSLLLAMVSAYLAAPHPVHLVNVSASEAGKTLSQINPAEVGALVFCRVPCPSWASSQKSFGEKFQIVTLQRTSR